MSDTYATAEVAAINEFGRLHEGCDIQKHPWQAVYGAGFEAGRGSLQVEVHLLRDVLAQIVGAFTSGVSCANCGEGVETCRCIIDLARTALADREGATR